MTQYELTAQEAFLIDLVRATEKNKCSHDEHVDYVNEAVQLVLAIGLMCHGISPQEAHDIVCGGIPAEATPIPFVPVNHDGIPRPRNPIDN